MKPNEKMLFGNLFDDERITPFYLERFADDSLAKFIQNNVGNSFSPIIASIQNALTLFKTELSDVDTSTIGLLSKTQNVDGLIANFKSYIKENYIHIASKLGGEKSPAYIDFFPNGRTEYSTVSKTKLPTLMARIKKAATTHSTLLGTAITNSLQTFSNQWDVLRSKQLQGKGDVKTNRVERGIARQNLEIALLKAIHQIADKYPGDVQRGKQFFNFNLLFYSNNDGSNNKPGTIDPNAENTAN